MRFGVVVEEVVFEISGQTIGGAWWYPDRPRDDEGGGPPPIVLLHEGLGCVARWARHDVPGSLCRATRRKVFAYDRAGYGRSQPRTFPWTPGFLAEEADRWLPAVMDAAGIERAVLYGHSDGATIALAFAAREPGRVAGLVAEAPHVTMEARTLEGIRSVQDEYAAPGGRLATRLEHYHGHRAGALFAAWTAAWTSPGFVGADIRDRLPDVKAPVVGIQGDSDPYGSGIHVSTIRRLCRGPVESWLIPGCGHAPHVEAEGLIGRIARFLNDLDGRPVVPA